MERREKRERAGEGRVMVTLKEDPLWYKDAIIYEVHVRAFADSDGNGIGDFAGLTERLDYLEDLGVTAIWLLPFYPSPLRDDGYDIADYQDVHPTYGTLADVRRFIKEAHRRGLRVITELVCNHTSDQHPWFQRARTSPPGSAARDFYVWSADPSRYRDARIIFKDFERSNWTWDPVAQAYYWHRFFSHQPDLNFENPRVRQELLRVVDFWMGMGVDGLRLDAVPYLFEREGTSCENLPETHGFLRELRRHVDGRFRDRMLLAEANQWPEEAVAYFGQGDECHVAFHFPLMPRLFMSIHMEDRFPIYDILEQTPPIPERCQWALFLRNHDELTLEMVTDEERDYMYRVYGQDPQARINLGIRRRLAPLLGNHRRKIELMNGLLFSLPGTPVIYYGDELGMGDNIYLGDRNGVRTPMQWSADRNAGFSRTNPQRLYLPIIVDPEYHYEAINVATQQGNAHSLLWWMKRLIALRKRHHAFGRGTLHALQPENRKVLAFLRQHGEERILVVANLSRFAQFAELPLQEHRGLVPVEMFGRVPFPPIGQQPYLMTLGPHAFYWFSLERPAASGSFGAGASPQEPTVVLLPAGAPWTAALLDLALLKVALPAYLLGCRWFGGKGRRAIKSVQVAESVPLPYDEGEALLAFLRVEDMDGVADTYLLPMAIAGGARGAELVERCPGCVLARLREGDAAPEEDRLLYDPLAEPAFAKVLLAHVAGRRRLRGEHGEVQFSAGKALRGLVSEGTPMEPSVLQADQSNTSVVFGTSVLLKLVRRLWPGVNPDVEIVRFLGERQDFRHVPQVLGSIEYTGPEGEITLGVAHGYVQSEGDAWRYTLDVLERYLERVAAEQAGLAPAVRTQVAALLDMAGQDPPKEAQDALSSYQEFIRLLGQRTAEMHCALAAGVQEPGFEPEPFTPFYQRSIYQSMRNQAVRALDALKERAPRLEEAERRQAEQVLAATDVIHERLREVYKQRISAMRIRHHGDYHLGQVLYTGKDFVIIDFEGEPARPLSERMLKRSPLRDVAGMVRSLHYATQAALRAGSGDLLVGRSLDQATLASWARYFYGWATAVFLRAYLAGAARASFVPVAREEQEVLLRAFLLEKALYEVAYELDHRPDWVSIPLAGLLQLLEEKEKA